MMKLSKNQCYLLLFMIIFLFAGAAYGATVTGIVTDAATGKALPGGNVIINTPNPTGAATDLRGKFIIAGIPTGDYKLTITYIGYQRKTVNISVQPGEVTVINVELKHQTLKGKEVVVTAQAAGQNEAINQQIRANNIKNIISAERIQEIPEASAAEAVGRLPGVSLRDDQMVIRGLSPHYNKIQIDGVEMASTSHEERSSGLGMISQYMLGGIELTKSAMADQEADAIGGTVNLIMKEAPEKPRLNILTQNGYNTLSESYANPKIILTGSNRYYHNLIGVLGQVSFERGHSASDKMTANYYEAIIDGKKEMAVNNLNLHDIDKLMENRIGASLVMDYTTNITKVKFSNFFSTSDNKMTAHEANFHDREITNSLDLNQSNKTVLNNALKIEHYVGNYKLNAGVSYAHSKNDQPEGLSAGIIFPYELEEVDHWYMPPIEIPEHRISEELNIGNGTLKNVKNETKCSENSQFSTNFDVQKRFDITDWMGIDLKMGGKYKHQTKEYDYNSYQISFGPAQSDVIQAMFESDIEWMPDNFTDFRPDVNYITSQFGGKLVVDYDYSEDDLLLGDYSLYNMPDMDKIKELHKFFKSGDWYWHIMGDSYGSDYHGTEDYLATYIMPQIELFGKLTFITGLRYERNQTEYTAWRVPYLEETRYQPHREIANFHVTRKRENEFFLPMIHGIYRPNDRFNVKTSYTHTLSRPRFGAFIPKWRISSESLSYNNPYLEPALSKNIDLYLSFYGNKLGLFTIGGFKKEIEDLIFDHGIIPLNQLGGPDYITEHFDGLPGAEMIGNTINWTMNNPRDAFLQGIELEWQSNFWYLPGLLKGLVLNVNFTKQSSEAKYPIVDKSQVIVGYDTTVVFGQEIITEILETVYTDTFYTSRMIDQADDLLNLSIGYDYKGFSIRASMKYTDNLFRRAEYYKNYREFTTGRYDYDIAIRQKLPIDGLNAFCNITNIGQSRYVVINKGSGWPTVESYSGIGVALGLRYKF